MTDNRNIRFPRYGNQPAQNSFSPQENPVPDPSGNRRGYIPPVRTAASRPQVPPYAAYPGNGIPSGPPPAGRRGFVPSGSVSRRPAGLRRYRRVLLLPAAALLAILCLVFAGLSGRQDSPLRDDARSAVERHYSIFCPGVYVDGLSLGGLTAEEGLSAVQSRSLQQQNSWHVDLTYNGITQTISADTLGMAVDFTSALDAAWEIGHNYNGQRSDAELYDEIVRVAEEPVFFSTSRSSGDLPVISRIVYTIKESVDRAPQNALMTGFFPDREEPFEYTDEVYGLNLDAQPLIDRITGMAERHESGTVEIVPDPVRPEQTKNDLKLLYVKLSEAGTPISSHSSDNRNQNIRLAFSRINGYRLDPGAVFSFNRIVGERTEKNQFWVFIGRTDAEAETPILWPPDAKN